MKVVIAIIFNSEQQILITQRSEQSSYAGFWEFPGGKIEKGETPEEALSREIKEELGIDINDYRALGQIRSSTPDKEITFFIYAIYSYQGVASCCELQTAMRWISREHLETYQFPEANIQIIKLIKDNDNYDKNNTSSINNGELTVL